MTYSNYSFCAFDDWIVKIQNQTAKIQKAKSTINKFKKRIWQFTQKIIKFSFFGMKGVGEYVVL